MDNPKRRPWQAQPLATVYQELQTSPEGLSDAEAATRLQKYGRNELHSRPPKTDITNAESTNC